MYVVQAGKVKMLLRDNVDRKESVPRFHFVFTLMFLRLALRYCCSSDPPKMKKWRPL